MYIQRQPQTFRRFFFLPLQFHLARRYGNREARLGKLQGVSANNSRQTAAQNPQILQLPIGAIAGEEENDERRALSAVASGTRRRGNTKKDGNRKISRAWSRLFSHFGVRVKVSRNMDLPLSKCIFPVTVSKAGVDGWRGAVCGKLEKKKPRSLDDQQSQHISLLFVILVRFSHSHHPSIHPLLHIGEPEAS